MKKLFLFFAVAISYCSTIAQTTFSYTGSLQTYTVPAGITSIHIDAKGAQGGSINVSCSATGGLGARMQGDFAVTPGDVITILVGQQGFTNGSDAGGGGGSFVVAAGNIPLIVAGGGGGASNNIGSCGSNLNGIDASITTSGTASGNGIIAGGTPGNGGGASNGSGGGGGGFYTDGTAGTGLANNNGKSYLNGGVGGTGNNNDFGGYGGGGAGWFTGGNGGGGGGYSGGGTSGSQPFTGGGGGGSYNAGTNQTNTAGFQTGNGEVVITPLIPSIEIDVRGNNTSIANGDITPSSTDSTYFGNVLACSGTSSVTYKIKNNGSGTMNLSGIPLVSITGTNASDFTVTSVPSATIATMDSTSFTISFDPGAVGTRNAIVTIANDDPDEGTFTFNIQGTGDADAIAPVTPTLGDITAECSSTPTAPTTTDNCAGTVTGTTSTTFPISVQGITVVTWSFTDGNGNTSTTTQNVIIDDITAPVSPTIANATGECAVTVTAPTTVDNCGGTITGTTGDPLTYSTQGVFMITWSFTDGNGNTSTSTQNVIVDDVTAPVADLASLPTITSCSAVTIAVMPTATDNCAGTITATTGDPLSYSTIGNYTITWSYTDPAGNTSTQTQSVNILDCSGVEEQSAINVNIYPNPSNGILNVGLDLIPEGDIQLRVIDALGQVVYSNILITNNTSLDLSHLSPATYFLQIMSNDGKTVMKKFIIN